MDEIAVIGARARTRNSALKPLAFLVGQWRTTGSHPLMACKTLSGRTAFAWQEGGAFLMMRSQVDDPAFPDGMAIFGSDDVAGTISMIYFDERGTSRIYAATVGERAVPGAATMRNSPKRTPSRPRTATGWSARAEWRSAEANRATICHRSSIAVRPSDPAHEPSRGSRPIILVLRRLDGSGIIDEYPSLAAYVARGVARPAYQRAFDAQAAVFAEASLG
jgi:hypothetical protein